MSFSIEKKIRKNELKNSINNIKEKSKKFHERPYLYSFTDHGISHSERMLQCVNSFLIGCKQTNLLNEYECYVLDAAIYLHDIGIQESKDDILAEFAKDYHLVYDESIDKPAFVRNNHHLISSYIIQQDIKKITAPIAYDGNKSLGEYISLVIEAHGIDFSKMSDLYKDYIFQNEILRVKLLSILLCLADCLDCDNRRIDEDKFKYTELPEISRIHWMKHLYVEGIDFQNRIITISYKFPELNKIELETYKNYFCYETEYWINNIKDTYIRDLNEFDIVFNIDSNINYSKVVDKLTKTDYNYIEKSITQRIQNSDDFSKYQKISIGILVNDDKVLMVKRKKPEDSIGCSDSKYVLEWQFPAGIVKAVDNSDEVIIKEVLAETGIKCSVDKRLGERIHPDTLTFCYYYSLIYQSGSVLNGDEDENDSVLWVPLETYKSIITSDIYWRVEEFLEKR